MAVNDVVVAIFFGGRAHPRGVGPRVVDFGHGEAAADVPGKEGLEIAFLLLGGTVFDEDFHVARVGGLTIEDIDARKGLRQLCLHQAVLQHAESHAPVFFFNLGQGEAQSADFGAFLLKNRQDRAESFVQHLIFQGVELVAYEVAHLRQ